MSHFAVLVFGDNVEDQLAPFHEFECTGHNDEYVQCLNITEEVRQKYESHTVTCLESPEGVLFSPWDAQFYRDPTPEEQDELNTLGMLGRSKNFRHESRDWDDGKGYRPKIQFVPEGFVEVEVPQSKTETLVEFINGWYGMKRIGPDETPDTNDTHKYGWVRTTVDGDVIEVIDRTNPNAKWDWYEVGGRWTGFFRLKANPAGIATVGKPGLLTPPADAGWVDSALKGDIDFDAMRAKAVAEALKRYDEIHAVIAGRTVKPWSEFQAEVEANTSVEDKVKGPLWEAAREAYHDQQPLKDLAAARIFAWSLEDYLVPRDAYEKSASDGAIVTFAVLKGGRWYERGQMGWWGAVSDEKDKTEWQTQFRALLDVTPDDVRLTVVDCHI